MARFSKARLVEELRDRSDRARAFYGFDPNNGTAQLRPRSCNKATEELINRAVEYGRWRATSDLATEVEGGQLGTADQ